MNEHPCVYIEELQTALLPDFGAMSQSSALRALKHDLNLSRKVLQKRARKALPAEDDLFVSKLRCWYGDPAQLVFIDETSKDGRDSMRRYAWSARGTRAIVRVPFTRGKRISVFAACDVTGFVAWRTTRGTFSRLEFNHAFVSAVLPLLDPWPLPRSIVVLDNSKIHMYEELADAVHSCGALLLYLPPYCPQFNPIQVMFGQLKRWLARHANLEFHHAPELVLEVAMRACMAQDAAGVKIFRHCGYADHELDQVCSNRAQRRCAASRPRGGGRYEDVGGWETDAERSEEDI